jgi:hypothetical protein
MVRNADRDAQSTLGGESGLYQGAPHRLTWQGAFRRWILGDRKI